MGAGDFEITEVDGVPAVVTPGSGPIRAGLMFRVGTSDEPLPVRGVTHLVEHLALFEATKGDIHANGFTEPSITSFVVSGTPAEVVEFFGHVCRDLRDLPRDRLEHERRVLQTEASQRRSSVLGTHLRLRYGARSLGLLDLPELGHEHLDATRAQVWATERFNRSNAVLWIRGEIPSDLRLDLPDGHRWPLADAEPLPDPTPAWYPSGAGTVALTFLASATPAARAALSILDARCTRRLRTGEGRVYATVHDALLAGPEQLLLYLAADCLPDQVEPVVDGLLAEAGVLATLGPTDEDLTRFHELVERARREESYVADLAASSARRFLAGDPLRTRAELEAQADAITASAIHRSFEAAWPTAYLTIPSGHEPRDRRFAVPDQPGRPVIGGPPHPRARRAADRSASDQFSVDAVGVALQFGEGGTCTIRWADVAAISAYANGGRIIWDREAIRLVFHPDEWLGGAELLAQIDAVAPTAFRVPIDRPLRSAYLESLPAPIERPAAAPRAEPRPPAPPPPGGWRFGAR